MKNIPLTIALLSSFIIAKNNKTTLQVDGMRCAYSCTGKVSNVIENIKGVKKCDVDFEKGVATVVFDEKQIDSKNIIKSLKDKTSYGVSELRTELDKKETNSI